MPARVRRGATTTAFLVAAACCPSVRAGDELLAVTRAGHRAAVGSIRTLSAAFVYEATAPKAAVVTWGRYWRSPDAVRIQEGKEGEFTSDHLVKGGEVRQVARGWSKANPVRYLAARRPGTEMLGLADVWVGMQLAVIGPAAEPMGFDRLLEVATRPPRATRETMGGRPCVRVDVGWVTFGGSPTDVAIWFDIGHNYLVRKTVWTDPKDGQQSLVAEVTEFAEPIPGVVVPVKCHRLQPPGVAGDVTDTVMSLSDLRVNQDIPARVFELPAIPANTTVSDQIKGSRYPADSNWNPIGPSTPYSRYKVAAPAPEMVETGHSSASQSEPESAARWVIYASVAVLVVAIGYWVVRRVRGRSA